MGGSNEGAKKRVETIKSRDPDFYRRIGSMGGKKSKGRFTPGSVEAREAGRLGGKAKKGYRKEAPPSEVET